MAQEWELERHTLQDQWKVEKFAMEEGRRIEKTDLENRLTSTEAKKMDALRVLQGVRAKQNTVECDLQRLRGAPSTRMSSQPSS